MSSIEPSEGAGEMDTCEIVARGLFVSGGDSSEVFERVEEALDEVALGVKSVVAVAFDGSVGLGRDDRFDAAHHAKP